MHANGGGESLSALFGGKRITERSVDVVVVVVVVVVGWRCVGVGVENVFRASEA